MWLWIRERIWRLFSRAPTPVPLILEAPPPLLPAPPCNESAPVVRQQRAAPDLDDGAPEFYFKKQILDKLDDYFDILGRMRKKDRDNYDLFARIGMTLTASIAMFDQRELSPWFRQTWPAFGAVAWGVDEAIYKEENKHDSITPRLLYFRKYTGGYAPPQVQLVSSGSVYVVTVYYDDHKRPPLKGHKPLSMACEMPVVVMPDGRVVALKTRITERVRIRGTHGPWRGRKFSLPQNRWGIPAYFEEWAREKRGHHGWPADLTAEQLIQWMFIFAANRIEEAQHSSVRVAVSKNRLTAIFGIPVTRSAYFFKDRERIPGTHSRIFHVVRAHERFIRNGKTHVRLHYRGLREFTWNGYDVTVFVPGRHGADLAEFNIGALDESFADEQVKTIGSEALGEFLRAEMLSGRQRINGRSPP